MSNFFRGNYTDPESPILPPPDWKTYLGESKVTFQELLKELGYFKAMIGKWYVGSHDSLATWSHGFDYTWHIGKNGLDFYNYSIFLDSYQHEWPDYGTHYLTAKLTE